MKGAAQFMLHWLIEDPKSGWLVTNPSTSPENTIKIKGKEHDMAMAGTMDMSIIRELFTALIKTTDALNIDAAFREQLIRQKKNYILFISAEMASCRNGSMIGMIRMTNTGISLIYSDCSGQPG
jgi:alpha-L-fucosidase 2